MRAAALVQIVLLLLFTAVGLVATVAVAADWLQGLDTWFWEETTCTIESSEAVERREWRDFEFQVSYRYRFRGESHLGDAYSHDYTGSEQLSEAEALASRYQPGTELGCWVDPNEPGRAYLLRSDLWQGLWILLPLLFVAVGVGSLWLIRRFRSEEEPKNEPTAPGRFAKRAKAGIGAGMMVVFFGIFFLFGLGFLLPFFVRPALEVVEARSWTELPCEIVSSQVRSHPGDDGATYSIDTLYRYQIGGREYRSNRYHFLSGSTSGYERKARIVEALEPGTVVPCYVDPEDPYEAVIERGFTGEYLFGLIPLIFVLVGVGGLGFAIHSLRAARRDAARPSWEDPSSPTESQAFSWAPPGPEAQPSSGPALLDPNMGSVGRLGCLTGIALFWNGIISLFVWQIVESWTSGTVEWFTILIVTPFVLIGLLLLASIPHSILALLNPRPRVQITPGTLRVGESAQLDWAFKGSASRIGRLEIWLEAAQIQTRSSGSGARVESKPLEIPKIRILDRERGFTIAEGSVSFTIPENTPPSSEGETSIKWTLRLYGHIAFWPDVSEGYVVQVLAASGSGDQAGW